MKLEISAYDCLCALRRFQINDIPAYQDDFGSQEDQSPETAEDYACGDMQFTGKPSTPEVLAKYGINQDEYDEVCSKLSESLSFGCCGWCV